MKLKQKLFKWLRINIWCNTLKIYFRLNRWTNFFYTDNIYRQFWIKSFWHDKFVNLHGLYETWTKMYLQENEVESKEKLWIFFQILYFTHKWTHFLRQQYNFTMPIAIVGLTHNSSMISLPILSFNDVRRRPSTDLLLKEKL